MLRPKLFTILKEGITKKQLTADVLSGIIVGVVALPLAIAFGIASGVTPQQGLVTAVVAGFLISAFGGSRVQIGGPTGAFLIIVYGRWSGPKMCSPTSKKPCNGCGQFCDF